MQQSPPPIDRLTRRDERAAVATLAAAFAEYPLLVALAPNAHHRPRVVEAFCRVLFHMSVRCDGAFATVDRSAVVCVWPPGSEWPSNWALLRPGGLSFLWRLGLRGARLLARIERELDVARLEHVPGPHWYIPLLGVRPEVQGRGLSRAVLQPVFEAADGTKLPIYLETVPEVNVAVYKKLGFELRGHHQLTGGLANWEMVREPRSC
jgi:GNAT superfamily N-acetyltransferase